MSEGLSLDEIDELQRTYAYLINYASDDPQAPIDPLTYVDSNGDNLLHIAAQLGDLASVQLLVRAGMNVDQTGDMGRTALHCAAEKKHAQVVDFLMQRGASSSMQDDFGDLPKI